MVDPNKPTQNFKRVTGIPKTFLEAYVDDGTLDQTPTSDTRKKMISYDGSIVVFAPNTREWDKFSSVAKSTTIAAAMAENEDNDVPVPEDTRPTKQRRH